MEDWLKSGGPFIRGVTPEQYSQMKQNWEYEISLLLPDNDTNEYNDDDEDMSRP